METPNNSEGRLTEVLMAAIRDHLKRDPPPQESHHYNRAYEAIYAVLRTVHELEALKSRLQTVLGIQIRGWLSDDELVEAIMTRLKSVECVRDAQHQLKGYFTLKPVVVASATAPKKLIRRVQANLDEALRLLEGSR